MVSLNGLMQCHFHRTSTLIWRRLCLHKDDTRGPWLNLSVLVKSNLAMCLRWMVHAHTMRSRLLPVLQTCHTCAMSSDPWKCRGSPQRLRRSTVAQHSLLFCFLEIVSGYTFLKQLSCGYTFLGILRLGILSSRYKGGSRVDREQKYIDALHCIQAKVVMPSRFLLLCLLLVTLHWPRI